MEFLVGHKFDVGALFTHGIRYLSREEEIIARQEAARRWAPGEPTEVTEDNLRDEGDVRFMEAVRRLIDAWMAGGKVSSFHLLATPRQSSSREANRLSQTRGTYITIPPLGNGQEITRYSMPNDLSKPQKWLVHNLIKTEYPGLKTRGMPACIQIEQRNGGAMEYEARIRESDLRIRKHVGFRWIAEALAGGDLSGLDSSIFEGFLGDGHPPFITAKSLSERLKCRLKEHRPILVGHNSFTDMVFFYRCFLGPLPNKVEDFTSLIHQTFPVMMDTKYLATQDFDAMNPSSSLEELNKTLAKIKTPKIGMSLASFFARGCRQLLIPVVEIDSLHSKYLYRGFAHEAGYDSMLTAIAFLKLATHLEGGKVPKGKRGRLEDISYGLATPTSTLVEDLFPTFPRNGFQEFFDTEQEGGGGQQAKEPVLKHVLAFTQSKKINDKVQHGILIPRLGTSFWRGYGNKLRVFGVTEKTVHFGPVEKTACLKPVKKTDSIKATNGVKEVDGMNDNKNPVVQEGILICFS
jgi:poly(A)-specific ribonuclease